METFGVLFGRLIRDKRGIEQLSQDDLATKSELTKARISDIENGKIKETTGQDGRCALRRAKYLEGRAEHLPRYQ
jgi:transcriptional regulator with XRE-family HTH domain